MANKSDFAYDIILRMRRLAEVADVGDSLAKEWSDSGFGSGGANEIVDADLTDYQISAADLTSAITLLQQFNNFTGNSAVSQGDYMSTLNKVRRGHSG